MPGASQAGPALVGVNWNGPPDNSLFKDVGVSNDYPTWAPEDYLVPLYYMLGIVSLALNGFSVYLVKRKSSFFSAEIRHLFMNVQVTCLLQNFHFTFLFQPIFRPFYGGGYCEGLLCKVGVKFHYNFVVFMATTLFILSSFIILLFNREQALLKEGANWRIRPSATPAFYIFTYSCLILPPICFIFYEMPGRDQYQFMLKERIDGMRWVSANKNWAVNDWSVQKGVWGIVAYVSYAELIVLGAIVIFFVAHIFYLAKTSTTVSSKNKVRYTAKAKNAFTILLQYALYLLLVSLPILITFVVCNREDSQVCQIVPEISLSLFSIVNAIVFIIGNKQYKKILIKRFFNIAVVNVMNSVTDSANADSTI